MGFCYTTLLISRGVNLLSLIRGYIFEARNLAEELNQLLRDDSMRLRLYHEYSLDMGVLAWTPDLYRRAISAEALCNKLEDIIIQKYNHELKKAS